MSIKHDKGEGGGGEKLAKKKKCYVIFEWSLFAPFSVVHFSIPTYKYTKKVRDLVLLFIF